MNRDRAGSFCGSLFVGKGKGGLLCDTGKRGQNMSKIITCEQVSNGHPDKICDQIADAIVTDILQHDRNARVAIECLLKKSQLFIAGEVTTDYRPNYQQIVHDVFNRIGAEKLGWNLTELLRIGILVDKQSPDIALGVDKGGAGDQGIMYGYATNETAEQMPIPYMVATKFLQLLKNHPSKMFRADAKAQVSYDYDTGRITTFLCSVQHSPDVEVSDFRHIIESMMVLAACEYGLDGDFTKLVNPTGRFVLGGSYADCGVTGRKLACDTYGGIGRMGGGALSGKDPTKVDRSAAYMARKIAKDIVQAGYADKCEVQLAYAIGVAEPVSIMVDTFGTGTIEHDKLEAAVRKVFDLTPAAIIRDLDLRRPIYRQLAAYGHMGREELGVKWENTDRVEALKAAVAEL
jgi:S-adenosylmethionine synthetase